MRPQVALAHHPPHARNRGGDPRSRTAPLVTAAARLRRLVTWRSPSSCPGLATSGPDLLDMRCLLLRDLPTVTVRLSRRARWALEFAAVCRRAPWSRPVAAAGTVSGPQASRTSDLGEAATGVAPLAPPLRSGGASRHLGPPPAASPTHIPILARSAGLESRSQEVNDIRSIFVHLRRMLAAVVLGTPATSARTGAHIRTDVPQPRVHARSRPVPGFARGGHHA